MDRNDFNGMTTLSSKGIRANEIIQEMKALILLTVVASIQFVAPSPVYNDGPVIRCSGQDGTLHPSGEKWVCFQLFINVWRN